jgi:hypothetical protein
MYLVVAAVLKTVICRSSFRTLGVGSAVLLKNFQCPTAVSYRNVQTSGVVGVARPVLPAIAFLITHWQEFHTGPSEALLLVEALAQWVVN